MRLFLLFTILGILAPRASSHISYNVSSAYVTYWGGLMGGIDREYKLDDIPFAFRTNLKKPKLKVHGGYDFEFKTLPKNSGEYEKYVNEADLNHNDYESYNIDEELSKKNHLILNKGFGQQMPFTATNLEAKTLKRTSCEVCVGLETKDGFLMQFKNLSFSVNTIISKAFKTYNLKIEMKGAELNQTVHLKSLLVGISSSVCRIKAPMRISVEGSISVGLSEMSHVHKLMMQKVCDKMDSFVRKAIAQVDSKSALIFELRPDLYFDMSVSNFSMDQTGFSLKHEGRFMSKSSGISKTNKMFLLKPRGRQETLEYINLFATPKIELLCEMMENKINKNYDLIATSEAEKNMTNANVIDSKELQENFKKFYGFFFKKDEPQNDLFIAEPSRTETIVEELTTTTTMFPQWKFRNFRGKRDTIVGLTTPLSTSSTTTSLKNNETFEVKNESTVVKVGVSTFNSLFESLISSQITKFELSDADLRLFCSRNSDSPLCKTIRQCHKMSELTKKFSLTIELMPNSNGKYFVFEDGAILTNFTSQIVFNGIKIKMNPAMKVKMWFEKNILNYHLLDYKLSMTAEEQIHKFFQPNVITNFIQKNNPGYIILKDDFSFVSNLENDVWTLNVSPKRT